MDGAGTISDPIRPVRAGSGSWFRYVDRAGAAIVRSIGALRALVAFALITLGTAVTNRGRAHRVVGPLRRAHTWRAGVRLLPMTGFLALAIGFVIIGQTVALLTRVGVQDLAGTVMVTVVVREIGPLAAALLVLAQVGTAYVVELGTARALGEVEALEAMCIDPVHYLVLPRVLGLGMAVFSLTLYFILIALGSGYLFAFLQDVPLLPGDYVSQLARSLTWEDFALLALKSCGFGVLIGLITCFQGLAQPLRVEEVSRATSRAVVQCVVGCILLDASFLVVYLVR